uniref:Pectate lyase n=1 Tax=viral metagenome TaxID=1070528 RepID=A0A6H1Z9S7_9ZZZZ
MRKIIIIYIFLAILLSAIPCFATDYYIKTNGSDAANGLSVGNAWKTFSKALGVSGVACGDTLYIENGTYNSNNQYSSGYMMYLTKTCTSGNELTIIASNDGQAVIDGETTKQPIKVTTGAAYINIEGLIFRNSSTEVVQVSGTATHINFRRCSAYHAGYGDYNLFIAHGYATYILFEDCVASQKYSGSPTGDSGRYGFFLFNAASYSTVRRCYVKYYSHAGGGGPCAPFSGYASNHNTFENNVADLTEATGECGGGYGERYWINIPSIYSAATNHSLYGNIGIAAGTYTVSYFGNVGLTSSDITWKDNVFYNFAQGILQSQSDTAVFENNTLYIGNNHGYYNYGTGSDVILKNSSLIGGNPTLRDTVAGMTHTYNNIYGSTSCYSGTTQGTGEYCNTKDPAYDTTTYGKGAYLMVPTALVGFGDGGVDIGAKVLYRYVDGSLTSDPLWPWPMENRIYNETGISVTYELNGGIWKTLSGVYSSPPATSHGKISGGGKYSGGAKLQ